MFEEAYRVREFGVAIEGRFILPARVDVEKRWIARGAIGLDRPTAWLRAGWGNDIAQRGRNGVLLALASVEAGEDEQFHRVLRSSGS